jgi:hypothetical protein
MATFAFSKSTNQIQINSYVDEQPGEYYLSVDNLNNILVIGAKEGGCRAEIHALRDTITINGVSFSGTAAQLKTQLLSDIFTNQSIAVIPYTKKVVLTDAQIKALPTTAIELVAAPGAGKLIKVISADAIIDTTAGGYVVDTNCRWQLFLGTQEITGLAQPELALATTPGIYFLPFPEFAAPGSGGDAGYLVTTSKSVTSMVNQPLKIKDDFNGVADYTGGNAANTVSVIVYYAEIVVSS